MANLHASNTYGRTGYRRLPATFDFSFINLINHELHQYSCEPAEWFAQLHERYDSEMGGKDEVSRHIIEAIRDTDFEGSYSPRN